MTTFTSKELRFADAAVTFAMSESQRRVWSSWYNPDEDRYPLDGSSLPREAAEVALSAVEVTITRLNAVIHEDCLGEDDAADTINDISLLSILEDELREGLSSYLEGRKSLFALVD